MKENRSMTQTEIQKQLSIPKSAVSRNIGALELKGLIEKETIGMSNLIRLKKTTINLMLFHVVPLFPG